MSWSPVTTLKSTPWLRFPGLTPRAPRLWSRGWSWFTGYSQDWGLYTCYLTHRWAWFQPSPLVYGTGDRRQTAIFQSSREGSCSQDISGSATYGQACNLNTALLHTGQHWSFADSYLDLQSPTEALLSLLSMVGWQVIAVQKAYEREMSYLVICWYHSFLPFCNLWTIFLYHMI